MRKIKVIPTDYVISYAPNVSAKVLNGVNIFLSSENVDHISAPLDVYQMISRCLSNDFR